jgi:hypothetical protein
MCVRVCVALSKYAEAFFPYFISLSSYNGYYLLPSARKLIYMFFLLRSCFLVFYKNVSSIFRHFPRIFSYSNFRTQHFVVQFVELLIERTCVVIIYQNHQQLLTQIDLVHCKDVTVVAERSDHAHRN